jgi:hypothetical protein
MLEIIVVGGSVGALVCVVLFGAVRYWSRRSDTTAVTIEPRWAESVERRLGDRIQSGSGSTIVNRSKLPTSLIKRSRAEVSWQDIRAGLCAFDPPPKMKVAKSEIIAVRVSPQDPDDFVAMAKMVATLYRPDEAQIEPIEVGRLMRARLQGEPGAFDITPLSSEDQLLELTKIARWDFNVRPKRSGQRWLQLVISVRVPEDGRVELRDLPALQRTIKVEVAPLETLKQFAAKRGEFIADKVLIPLIVLFAGALGVTAWLTGLFGGSEPTSTSPPAVPANVATQEAPAQSSSQKSPEQ